MDFYFLRPSVLSNMHQKYLFLVSIAKDGGQKNIQIYTPIFSINQEDVSHELCVFSYTCRPIFLSLLPHILSSSIMALFLFSHGLSISPVHLYLSQVKSSNNKSLSLSRPWRGNFAPPFFLHDVGAPPRRCGTTAASSDLGLVCLDLVFLLLLKFNFWRRLT
jgi:hypothetical protein